MTSAPLSVSETSLPGVVLVSFVAHRDQRGFFLESYNARTFADVGLPTHFVQDNHSRSAQGVLRGLHFQLTSPQGKLVRVTRGRIYDVAADVRAGSPTFGQWVGIILDDERLEALWIAPGFAHGFCALSDEADVVYKCTEQYDADDERGVVWNDPTLAIDWPVREPLVSDRDASLPQLSEMTDFPAFVRLSK